MENNINGYFPTPKTHQTHSYESYWYLLCNDNRRDVKSFNSSFWLWGIRCRDSKIINVNKFYHEQLYISKNWMAEITCLIYLIVLIVLIVEAIKTVFTFIVLPYCRIKFYTKFKIYEWARSSIAVLRRVANQSKNTLLTFSVINKLLNNASLMTNFPNIGLVTKSTFC
jgi:hypothetical protein